MVFLSRGVEIILGTSNRGCHCVKLCHPLIQDKKRRVNFRLEDTSFLVRA